MNPTVSQNVRPAPAGRRARLAGTTALMLVLASSHSFAEQRNQGCALIGGMVPETCVQANDGQVVAREVPSNVQTAPSTNPGDLGFSITTEQPASGPAAIIPPTTTDLNYDISENPGAMDIEPFSTGIIDLTFGRDLLADETYTRGRIAGFAEGVWKNGIRYTASVDTREGEFRDLFSNFGRKHPDQMLRNIKDEDVWVTTGDDSTSEQLAPTSGKVYLKLEKDGSHILWGDFRPDAELGRIVRSDRALYGLEGTYQSPATTTDGAARYTFSGYAAQPDSLVQRDVFRGTGGSSYFLSRRDVQDGTETLIVETRDPVSGRVISQVRLAEGIDYRIDYLQGVVILNAPLAPSTGGGGVVIDRPLGDYDLNLVAQYEYVPTTGDIDGIAAGARAEGWVNDALRVGVSAQTETTGIADNTLVGVDILLRRSEGTYLSFDIARSEGPGFGVTTSLNGGLEIDPSTPSAGVAGAPATGLRFEGRVDLADYGGRGYVLGYFDDREEGFSSPDLDIAVSQQAFGIEGEVGISERTALTFGYDQFKDDAGKRIVDARLGVVQTLSDSLTLEVEVNRTDRRTPGSTLAADNGKRTDLGAKLTWARTQDTSLWVFGQATLERSGGLAKNNRLGVGVETQLTEVLSFTGEISAGDQGPAGLAQLVWNPRPGTTYSLGYRLDPTRAAESSTMSGKDRGSIIVGASSQINDQWRYTAENTYSAFGSEPAMTNTYGVTYTPSETLAYDAGFIFGSATESDGTDVERTGVSLGMRYTNGDAMSAGLRGEYRIEDSNNPVRVQDRNTLLVAGYFDRRVSDNWRLVGNLDAVISRSDEDSIRDGRYVEAKLGYAYRPVDSDRLNALFSYTYLYDIPGADQVNVDGDVNGPKQRSHILNAAMSYDLNQQFTLGAKYGYRWREEADRSTSDFVGSAAHLGILRMDYHVVHNWDIMAEGRAMAFPEAETTEFGALLGVYRDVGDNMRLGAGYTWGAVSDDLRSMEPNREGIFLNLIGKF
jgi:hypothetical protein